MTFRKDLRVVISRKEFLGFYLLERQIFKDISKTHGRRPGDCLKWRYDWRSEEKSERVSGITKVIKCEKIDDDDSRQRYCLKKVG